MICIVKGLNPGVINFVSKLNMIVRMNVVLKGLFLTVTVSTTCAVDTIALAILTTAQMTTAQVVETSVTVNKSPVQDYIRVHPLDNHAQPTYDMLCVS